VRLGCRRSQRSHRCYGSAIIVLNLPDDRTFELSDADARRLADLLWEKAEQKRTAVVAVAIQYELRRPDRLRHPIDVPLASVERVNRALNELP